MRKIILSVIIFVALMLSTAANAEAQSRPAPKPPPPPLSCSNWVCPPETYNCDDQIGGCQNWCSCGDEGGVISINCGPGYYVCNNACCAVGTGGGGGKEKSCSWSQVNCPAGGTRTNQVAAVSCGSSHCPAPGTAQAVTGCCGEGKYDEDGWYCGNQQVTTYSCCPPNTAPTETLVNGGTYTTAPSCGSAACNDGDDLYIGSGAVQSKECGWDCSFWDGEGDDQRCRSWNRIWRNKTTTTCQERHLEYSCVPTCDANNWGEWSACSATCGGGTQTRTNACGTPQSQVCNTQSCQGPWWQVKDGDITTNGDIVSRMPSGYYLDTIGGGGFPGVPVYKDQIGIAPGTISSTLWNANTSTSLPRIFDYSYFENLIPDDTVINDISKLTTGVGATTDINGYEWYKVTGNIDTAGNIDFGSRKVILFIEGHLNVGGNINLTDGAGFFVSFVSGNISIAGTATSLEGIYESNGSFTTGVGTSQLLIRGSVASYGTITMQRDLADDTVTPAELFEFAPDQVMLFPQKLMYKRTKWAEVAP